MNLVSIITPVYNSEKYLADNISSVLAQTYKNWELILVDDCSSDTSEIICESFEKNDSRIKYYRLAKNSGAGIARNKAIEMANGKFIAFLDSDDTWYPKKLEKQLNFMKENDYHFTFTDYNMVDEAGNDLNKLVKCKSFVNYNKALYKNPIGCLTVIYSVDFFGKQYMPSIRKRQDYALWLLKYEWQIYRDVEGLSFLKSAFYTVSAIILKLKSYF